MTTVFHTGELAAQRRMGQADSADRVGRIIRPEIPTAAAAFLAEQPMVVLAAADDAGRVWTGQLVGLPGFAHAEDARTVAVDARPVSEDPLAEPLRGARKVGLIALQPQRRRRMRVNGTAGPTDAGLRITTDQVYSNCPKYISRRAITRFHPTLPGPARRSATLDVRQQRAVFDADTFFIGTIDAEGNADASHRGGNPGFLQVLSPSRLRWPDYRGNSMFMTLGNLVTDPRCGLFIPDWHTGTTLQLTGAAEILWDETGFAPGAQCAIEFEITEVVEIPHAGPLRWGPPELSPVNPA